MRRKSGMRTAFAVLVSAFVLASVSDSEGSSSPGSGALGKIEQLAGRAGWEDPFEGLVKDDMGRVYRVRETIYTSGPAATPSPNQSSMKSPAPESLGPPHTPTPAAPHITSTLGPLFTFFIHHPIRAAPFVFRFAWASTKSITKWSAFILHRIFLFFLVPCEIIFQPALLLLRLIASLQAIWLTALAAVLSGCGIGALAGVLTADQARSIYERRWGRAVDLAGGGTRRCNRSRDGGTHRGAQVERVNSKGKGRAMDGSGWDSTPYLPLDGAGVPEAPWYGGDATDSDRDRTPRAARQLPEWKRFLPSDLDEDEGNHRQSGEGTLRSGGSWSGSDRSSHSTSSTSSAGTVTRVARSGSLSFRRG